MTPEQLETAIAEGIDALGHASTPQQAEQYTKLLTELERWNRRINLTAIRDLREMVEEKSNATPEEVFERSWARTVLARVVDRLRHEYEAADQGRRFSVLKVYLLAGEAPVPYADSALDLGLTESAVKSAIYKLRQRYGEMLRSEIAQTLSDPSEVDDEIRYLLHALSR